MEWLPIPIRGINILITVTLSYSLTFGLDNYVTPNETAQCSNGWSNCLILEEYASHPNDYFKNNTIFQFEPGSHRLNRSLHFINLNNFTLLGKHSEETKVLLDSLVHITWENCSNIELSLISFIILEGFIFSIILEHSHLVHFSDISVYGNENIGCSSILSQYSMLHVQDSKFAGIQGSHGAAMRISKSCVIFTGNNTFSDNSASYGGSLYIFESVVTLSGINTFVDNTSPDDEFNDFQCLEDDEDDWFSGSGGAIYCNSSSLIIDSEYSVFANNFAEQYGGAIHAMDGNITIKGSVTFMENVADEYKGGAMFLEFMTLIISGNTSFINNKASDGGALSISGSTLLIVGKDGMANENFIFNEATKFCRNVAEMVSIEAEYFRVLGSDFNESDRVVAVFHGNIATSGGGGIQSTHNSDISIFDGSIYFENNTAMNGGGIYLGDNSKLILSIQTDVSFVLNHAKGLGGALYVDDSQCSTHTKECFLSIYGDNFYTTTKSSLFFLNNSAGFKGSILYGGQLNKCRLSLIAVIDIDVECGNRVADYRYKYNSDALVIFQNFSRIRESESASSIASQPEQIQFCQFEGEKITLDVTLGLEVYPGEKFNISVIALDQISSPVPATVFIEKKYRTMTMPYYYEELMKGDKYHLTPSRQSINGPFCTNLTYKLYFAWHWKYKILVHFKLYHENPCQNLVDGLSLSITIKRCPIGFELAENQQCFCSKRLLKFTNKCSIEKSIATIEREKNNFWISQIDSDVLLIHDFRCPLDYCKDIPQDISLSDPSFQCDFNRTGIVCGKCRKNFSLALGSLHCIPCDNKYSSMILFFIMAGLALIAIIFLFRLIVSFGTLNGLFFYANIVQANHQAYFPRETVNFFTTFISWLNLDLGIETCFYDGMDIYAYSWLQFLFPFYLWLLVGCIILACRYSQSIAKRLGKNPVAVLATLVLMSYSKILGAAIVPLTWTYLTYYSALNETRSEVWMYDASLPYFREPKHIALGLHAILCLVVIVLPYILLLVFGHWLQRCSNWRIFSWLNKIKPFMDAYHAPYRKHTRYWIGLLLLSRLGLFLTFANSSEGINLLAVSSVSISLLAIHRRVYEKRWKDLLESSYILNLGIFSVATYYLKEESENDKNQLILSSISVGIAFITFLGILLFHISLVLKSSNFWKEHMIPFIQKSQFLSEILGVTVIKDNATERNIEATVLHALPTTSEVAIDLNKPLLLEISTDAATYD